MSVFGSELIGFSSYEITIDDSIWDRKRIVLSTAPPAHIEEFGHVITTGTDCPNSDERLLICYWIGFSEIVVIEGFQNRNTWTIGGIKFINHGVKNIKLFDVNIKDAYLISTYWKNMPGEYQNRISGSFQFVYSESLGLIALVRFKLHKANINHDSRATQFDYDSSFYWIEELPVKGSSER